MKEEKDSSELHELQIVAWKLGDETYGMDIACIHTVITFQAITPVPQTQPYVKGIMNLRGQIVPVIDLRQRFGMAEGETTSETRIVIINAGNLQAGLIVDSVSEVLRIPESNIEAPNQWINTAGGQAIVGIGKVAVKDKQDRADAQRLIILLNPAEVLSGVALDSAVLAEAA